MCRSLTSAPGVVVSSDDAVPQGTSAPRGFASEPSAFLEVDLESLTVAIRDAFHPVFLYYTLLFRAVQEFCCWLQSSPAAVCGRQWPANSARRPGTRSTLL